MTKRNVSRLLEAVRIYLRDYVIEYSFKKNDGL